MKTFFYYLRDGEGRPVITVCLMDDGVQFARGVAICSLKDNPMKKIGRGIAYERALHGFVTRSTGLVVNRDEARIVQQRVAMNPPFAYKSYGEGKWFPEFELELIKKMKGGENEQKQD